MKSEFPPPRPSAPPRCLIPVPRHKKTLSQGNITEVALGDYPQGGSEPSSLLTPNWNLLPDVTRVIVLEPRQESLNACEWSELINGSEDQLFVSEWALLKAKELESEEVLEVEMDGGPKEGKYIIRSTPSPQPSDASLELFEIRRHSSTPQPRPSPLNHSNYWESFSIDSGHIGLSPVPISPEFSDGENKLRPVSDPDVNGLITNVNTVNSFNDVDTISYVFHLDTTDPQHDIESLPINSDLSAKQADTNYCFSPVPCMMGAYVVSNSVADNGTTIPPTLNDHKLLPLNEKDEESEGKPSLEQFYPCQNNSKQFCSELESDEFVLESNCLPQPQLNHEDVSDGSIVEESIVVSKETIILQQALDPPSPSAPENINLSSQGPEFDTVSNGFIEKDVEIKAKEKCILNESIAENKEPIQSHSEDENKKVCTVIVNECIVENEELIQKQILHADVKPDEEVIMNESIVEKKEPVQSRAVYAEDKGSHLVTSPEISVLQQSSVHSVPQNSSGIAAVTSGATDINATDVDLTPTNIISNSDNSAGLGDTPSCLETDEISKRSYSSSPKNNRPMTSSPLTPGKYEANSTSSLMGPKPYHIFLESYLSRQQMPHTLLPMTASFVNIAKKESVTGSFCAADEIHSDLPILTEKALSVSPLLSFSVYSTLPQLSEPILPNTTVNELNSPSEPLETNGGIKSDIVNVFEDDSIEDVCVIIQEDVHDSDDREKDFVDLEQECRESVQKSSDEKREIVPIVDNVSSKRDEPSVLSRHPSCVSPLSDAKQEIVDNATPKKLKSSELFREPARERNQVIVSIVNNNASPKRHEPLVLSNDPFYASPSSDNNQKIVPIVENVSPKKHEPFVLSREHFCLSPSPDSTAALKSLRCCNLGPKIATKISQFEKPAEEISSGTKSPLLPYLPSCNITVKVESCNKSQFHSEAEVMNSEGNLDPSDEWLSNLMKSNYKVAPKESPTHDTCTEAGDKVWTDESDIWLKRMYKSDLKKPSEDWSGPRRVKKVRFLDAVEHIPHYDPHHFNEATTITNASDEECVIFEQPVEPLVPDNDSEAKAPLASSILTSPNLEKVSNFCSLASACPCKLVL